MLVVSVLTACLTVAGITTYPSAALAAQGLYQTRPAVPVTVMVGATTTNLVSSADDVGALLEEQGVALGTDDEVHPSLADRLTPNETVRVVRVNNWTRTVQQSIAATTVHRISLTLAPGRTKLLSQGTSGLRETMVRFTQRDGGNIAKHVVGSRIVRSAKPRVIAEGVGEYEAFERFGNRGLDKTAYVARAALTMIATAYTANCYGCSGVTATGRPAGHGVVAVDPRVIRLGTRLYIPGYGYAIAGDTGGAIRGNRIDLGFNSYTDALRFGRRAVVVYRLK
ncbi:MAG: 3D domain-containing protein [Candidatus Eremiobacteraeota bacterium]|nr:3D domain-containing protein [Candidatus Eremiobacteraeota bacterium]